MSFGCLRFCLHSRSSRRLYSETLRAAKPRLPQFNTVTFGTMDGDNVELTYKKKKKQRRVRCIAVIVAFIVVFFIGFLIGYFAFKAKESTREHKGDRGRKDKTADFQKHQEEIMNHHKAFQSGVSEEQLEESLK